MKSIKIVTGFLIGVGIATSILAGSPTFAATQTSQSCVDGTDRSNLKATLDSRGTVTIGTVNNKPLCENLTLNFSSYSLPDNYNGQGFKNNDTAIPQTQYANTVVTLGKGTTKPATIKVPTPEACKATQVDLYYGKNQTEITTSEGLVGTDAIVGKIYDGTGTCVNTSVQKTQPQAPSPEPVVTTTAAALPSTGFDPVTGGIATTLIAGGAYAAVRIIRSRLG